jgi:outer membrane protein assembly factor BamE (lipoprotein component of BamABCDE complex)
MEAKMVNRSVGVLVIVLFVLGCAGSSKNMNKLRLGMSKTEVVDAMGQPDSSSANRNVEYLKYRFHSDGLFTSEYYVKLQDGRVDAYGRAGDFGLGY